MSHPFLKQSTAVVISFGPFVDKTDGVALETGLVTALDHASTGIMLSKNGGTLAVRHATVTASTYDAHGCYKVTLDTTDTGTLGSLRVIYTDAATCLPVWRDFQVLPPMIYDSFVAGSDRLDVNVTHIGDTSQTARDIGASVLLSPGTGAGQLDFTLGVVKSNAVQWLGGTIPAVNVTGVPLVDAKYLLGTIFATPATAGVMDVNAKNAGGTAWNSGAIGPNTLAADTITAGKIAADAIGASELAADAITEIRDAITGGAYALSTDSNGRVRIVDGTAAGELDTAAGVAKADAVTLGGTTITANEAANWHNFYGNDGSPSTTELDGLARAVKMQVYFALALRKDAAIAADRAAELAEINLNWGSGAGAYANATDANEAIRDNMGTTQTGDAYAIVANGTYGNLALKNLIDAVDNFVDTEIADIQSRLPAALVGGRMDSSVGAMAANSMTAAASAADFIAEIQSAVTGGAYALSTDANGRVRIVDGTAAGELDTLSGNVTLADGSLTTAKLGAFALAKGTNITGFNDLSAAAVNVEVVDALNVDAYTEPGQGNPPVSASIQAKLSYLYKGWRNKATEIDGLTSLFNDGGTVVDQKATSTDDSITFTKGQWATGP